MVEHAFRFYRGTTEFTDFLARQVIEACEAKGMHGFKVAFRISGQVKTSPSEELLSMLMLLYADDLVLLAPSRSDLKTALEELERITREWGMAVNYPKTEAVVFGPFGRAFPPPPPPPRSKLDPRAWQSSLSSSMWAALCRQTGARTRSSRGGCAHAQQGRSSDPCRQLCSPPGA